MVRTLTLAAAFGALTGLRSMAAPALVSHALGRRRRRRPGPVEGLLQRPDVALTCGLLAAGEVVADKLPQVPARIAPLPLAGRFTLGALTGAAVAERGRRAAWAGAAAGGAAAVAAAFAGYHARRAAGRAMAVPDPLLGLAEDIIVYGAGARLQEELP